MTPLGRPEATPGPASSYADGPDLHLRSGPSVFPTRAGKSVAGLHRPNAVFHERPSGIQLLFGVILLLGSALSVWAQQHLRAAA